MGAPRRFFQKAATWLLRRAACSGQRTCLGLAGRTGDARAHHTGFIGVARSNRRAAGAGTYIARIRRGRCHVRGLRGRRILRRDCRGAVTGRAGRGRALRECGAGKANAECE